MEDVHGDQPGHRNIIKEKHRVPQRQQNPHADF